MISSLDPDDGRGLMTPGDRHPDRTREAGQGKAAQDVLLAAWRLYTFGRWPVAIAHKVASAAKARAAFEVYGRLVDPVIAPISIPFEDREIIGCCRSPRM
jgi:hypothetical protein